MDSSTSTYHNKCGHMFFLEHSVYDLRQCNIDKLRWWLGTFDWTPVIACDSVTTMYSQFLQIVCDFITVCIPVKTVTIGPCDPDFVTPFVKSLLVQHRKLRKQGFQPHETKWE